MRSEINADVPVASPGEFHALKLGPLEVYPPVVLAPMAGVTNAPFRTLCRRFSKDRCLYVSEMITARAFAEGHARTLKLASFGEDEKNLRSIQLYGTHPDSLADATKTLVNEWGVHHIDMNFGCPVRKVTANGGGSAIPVRPRLMARLVRAVIGAAGDVPVTIKFRMGIDEDILTWPDAARVGESEGVKAVALHARTAAQLYSGEARWDAVKQLVDAVSIPVLGNGDIFESWDALRMMRETGCQGVVIGRGCLGRPWLFGELVDVFDGREPGAPPNLGKAIDTALEHAALLIEFFGEKHGMHQMRKFTGWYLKSFPNVKRSMDALHRVSTMDELRAILEPMDRDTPFPPAALRARRAKTGRTQKVSLPQGFLENRDDDRTLFDDLQDAAGSVSGG